MSLFAYYINNIPREFFGYSFEFVSYMKTKPTINKFNDDFLYNFTIGATNIDLNMFKIRTFLNSCYNSIIKLDHNYIYESKLIDLMVLASRNNRNELKNHFTSLLSCILCKMLTFNLFNKYPDKLLVLLWECRNNILTSHARIFISKIKCQSLFNKYKYYKYITFVIQHYETYEELKNIIYLAPNDIPACEMLQILVNQVINKLTVKEQFIIVRAIYLKYGGINYETVSLYITKGLYNLVKFYTRFRINNIIKEFNRYLTNSYIKHYIKNKVLKITKRKFEDLNT